MTLHLNAYATVRDLPPLEFPHEAGASRDRSDPELATHLDGFAGFVFSRGEEQMTQAKFHVIAHIQRVQHHLVLYVEEEHMDACADWAARSNSILFLPDGTVRDPSGNVLIDPESGEGDDDAHVPYPTDAEERKANSVARLSELGVRVPASLPPVVAECEVQLRSATEVAERALALLLIAVRAEALGAEDEPIPQGEMTARFPSGYAALSPNERAFLDTASPERQEVVNAVWRYEALAVLQWALGLTDRLSEPTAICDVPAAAKLFFSSDEASVIQGAKLRPASAILDALDFHYRLHWAVRQARIEKRDSPGSVEPGVVAERHYALNWLVRFQDAEWDDVDTPT